MESLALCTEQTILIFLKKVSENHFLKVDGAFTTLTSEINGTSLRVLECELVVESRTSPQESPKQKIGFY